MNDLVHEVDETHPSTSSDDPIAANTGVAGISPRHPTLRDLLLQVFYHATLLRLCLCLGLAFGLAATALVRPNYVASTLVLVFIGPESAPAQDGTGLGATVVSVDGLKVVQSEIQIIQTDQVIRAAIEKVGAATIYPAIAKPRWFGFWPGADAKAQLGAAVQRFRGGDLRVESEAGSNLIRISFAHPDREIAIRVVRAMLDAYLAKRREIYAGTNSSFIGAEIDRYRAHLAGLEQDIQALRVRYDVLDLPQDIVLATNRLEHIEQRQDQLHERRVAVETELGAVKANLAQQKDMVLDFRETTNNTGNDEARNTLVRLEQERAHLTIQYRADWPGLNELNKKIDTIKSQISSSGGLYSSERLVKNPTITMLDSRLASLTIEGQALEQQLNELEGQFRTADKRIKLLREVEGPLHALQLDRDVSENVYRQLSSRQPAAVFQDNMVDERNANLRVVQPPTAPILARSMMASYVIGGLFFGLVLGIAASVVASMLRQVYITPAEAEQDLAVPFLGEFATDVQKATPADLQDDITNLAALLQEVIVGGRKLSSLQIVGVSEKNQETAEREKAAMVRALGMELATGYELKTLILDLQGDGGAQAATLGQDDAGASTLVTSAMIRVVATRISALWVSVGAPQSIVGNRRAPIAASQLVLDSLTKQFGMVLVVASADTSNYALRRLAGMVDSNLLVLRAEQTRGLAAARLSSSILSAGGNILGFIFVGRKYYLPNWLYRWA